MPFTGRRNKAYVNRVKLFKGCRNCGYKKCSTALEFHHLDSFNKKSSISKLVRDEYSLASIKRELRKCIILCANCHREEHERLGGEVEADF